MALFGLLDLAIFNYPRWTIALWPAIVLFFLVGIPGCVGYVAMLTLFQQQAPDGLRGRMYAVLSVGQATAGMLGATVAGLLGQRVSVLSLLTAQGAGYLLAALLLRPLADPDSLARPDMLAGPAAGRQPLRRSTSARRIAHDSSSSTLPGCGLRKRLTSIATSARSHRMR
jgi:MFS family permease